MKILILILALANILFLTLTYLTPSTQTNPDQQRLKQEISPERIQILSVGQAPEASPKKAP